ncbi:MAG: MFS transporter [Actinomycetota bacterium]
MDTTVAVAAGARAPRREQRGWYFYDWANSAFPTTVVTVFLGPYLTTVTRAAADPAGFVHPLGVPVRAESFFPYAVAVSVALQVLVLPVAGAIADRTRRKRAWLGGSAYLGALATAALFTVSGSSYLWGGLLFVLANVAYGTSVVVYNSFLPEIAEPAERDRVSSRGWALGYLGGGLLLAGNLALFTLRDRFGVGEGDAVRISLASAGVWWALFTLVPLVTLRDRGTPPVLRSPVLVAGFRQLWGTLRAARGYPRSLLFLVAFLLYNDGIQSVIAFSAVYGSQELGLGQGTLVATILLVQFVAFGGALLLGALAGRWGARRVVLGSLGVWVGVLAAAYVVQRGAAGQFLALAVAIGLVLGAGLRQSRVS